MSGIDWDALSPVEQSEASVLAGVLSDNDLLDELGLTVDDFLSPRFANTWELMLRLRMQGQPVDPIGLGHHQPANLSLFWDLTSLSYTDPLFHADIVRQSATRRKLAISSIKIKSLAENVEMPLSDVEDECRAAVDAAIGLRLGSAPRSGDLVAAVLADIGKSEPAYRTPWPKLTQGIRGLRDGGLYIIGARPGVGKSALALQMATMMETYGHVGFFSLEMPKEEVTKRLISQQTEIAYAMIDGGRALPDWAAERVAKWQATYPGRILFDDRGEVTVSDIRAQVRTWVRQHGDLHCIVVDYLQLMSGSKAVGASRVEAVGEISRQLKLIARDFGIVVIALSQLNRNPEQRADKVPAMSDLRESGSIEQDADVIMLMHREMSLSDNPQAPQFVDLIVAKNRQGRTGKITLDWEGEFMRATGGQL
jgi:replicative DNA helicase